MLRDRRDCFEKWKAGGWFVGREKNELIATKS